MAKRKNDRGKAKGHRASARSPKRTPKKRAQPSVIERPVDSTERDHTRTALRDSEEDRLLKGILQSSSDGILATNRDNQVLFANKRFVKMWKIPQEVIDQKDDSLLLQYVLDQLSDPQGFLKKTQELYNATEGSFDTLHFKDGRVFERFSRPLMQKTELLGRVWSFRDVTEQKRVEHTLQQAEVKYRILIEQIPVAVYLWELGEGGRCHYISPQIEAMLGFSVEEWLTDPDLFFRQVHPDDRGQAIAAENHSRATGEPLRSEFRMLTRDGRIIWVRDESFVLPKSDGQAELNQGVLMDISERKQVEEELRRAKDALEIANLELQQALEREKLLACTDGLTGLYNHRHFFELAEREFQAALRYQRPLAFLMFDMDDFKQVNDTLGHAAGDKLLARVAQMTVAHVRASDVVARYGGDEFIVLLPHASARQALPIAERLRASVSAIGVETVNELFTVRLSVGIAETQHEPADENVEHVIQRADQALYQAKRMGRNRTVIYDFE